MIKRVTGGQIVRIFRPDEISALIGSIDIMDESSFTASRNTPNLRSSGMTTDDVRAWMRFLLYTGTRFAEACIIHKSPSLYQGNGIIDLPYYLGKEKRTIKAREIRLSFRGREIMKDFFDAREFPASNGDQITQALTSFSTMMHRAGKRIELPEQTFQVYRKRYEKDEKGDFRKNDKGKKIRIDLPPKSYMTNGCVVRSMRKTWESWLYVVYAVDGRTESRVMLSLGHTKQTALEHYLNYATFDDEDVAAIRPEVEGFGVIGQDKGI